MRSSSPARAWSRRSRPTSRASRSAPAQDSVAFRREAGGWTIDGTDRAVPAELAAHIDIGAAASACQRARARDRAGRDCRRQALREFGLDPPASVVMLGAAKGPVATVNFGVLNPAGTSQYVRLGGSPDGLSDAAACRRASGKWRATWRAGCAHRPSRQWRTADASLLLPVSMAQVWAVEIVAGGKLTRFERDSAGNWFRHTGQHSHAASANAHVADPAQAPHHRRRARIARRDRGRDPRRPRRRCRQLARFGLSFPPMIVCSMRATTRPQWRGSNSAARPTASIAMRGLRRRRGRHGRRVRGQAAHRSAQGGGGGVVSRSLLIPAQAGNPALGPAFAGTSGREPLAQALAILVCFIAFASGSGAGAPGQSLDRARRVAAGPQRRRAKWRSRAATPTASPARRSSTRRQDLADPAKVAASAGADRRLCRRACRRRPAPTARPVRAARPRWCRTATA